MAETSKEVLVDDGHGKTVTNEKCAEIGLGKNEWTGPRNPGYGTAALKALVRFGAACRISIHTVIINAIMSNTHASGDYN
jgi:hypothetical protein